MSDNTYNGWHNRGPVSKGHFRRLPNYCGGAIMMDYSNIKKRIVNFTDKAFTSRRYAIANEYGTIAFAYGNCEQDALDAAADSGHLDSERMSPDDYNEYSDNGWDDSFCYLGNRSEPFWCQYLHIREV